MLRVARVIRVRGIVQGVGFRPFAYRLARRYALDGWVFNGSAGVEIHVEGQEGDIAAFERALTAEAPPAAQIAAVEGSAAPSADVTGFTIRDSSAGEQPTVRIAPDIATCAACLRELFDPADRRYRYPYINCTDCGPRYSIIEGLPYDRALTTMAAWEMCADCRAEYEDPGDRRFHAQPVACHVCGPAYVFELDGTRVRGEAAIAGAARALARGAILALKGIGGFHLACDARNAAAVRTLRERKFRKERPFAVMVRDLETARALADLDPASIALLTSAARPIVLVPRRDGTVPAPPPVMPASDDDALAGVAPGNLFAEAASDDRLAGVTRDSRLAGVAPDNCELGIMLPYAPLHALLFAFGAPDVIVLTSANRSSEPIAYDDEDARHGLTGIADGFLIGERPIARRIDDSVARVQFGTPAVLRRSRGFAPQAVCCVPASRPIIAVGADLKNAVALVIDGAVIVGAHIGDLAHYSAREACAAAVRDLCATYDIAPAECLVVHDAHPEYVSTALARDLSAQTLAVQHHRAHIAGVIAEREAWSTQVIGIACDGTGYGDDGTIWGGECFLGSVAGGFVRVAHLRPAKLPGGDAAARFPVQAAAGFLLDIAGVPDLEAEPFGFSERYRFARDIASNGVRTFTTTSFGRLFDAAAALCGFVREATFEGQAAMWLEHLAGRAAGDEAYPFPLVGSELDYRPLLSALLADRACGRPAQAVARAFHCAVRNAVSALAAVHPALPVVASGGVFQNRLLCELLRADLGDRLWLGTRVPPNDGGICVGQAALAAHASAPTTHPSRPRNRRDS